MLDLGNKKKDPAIVAEEGYTFEVEFPDGTPTGAFITVRGEYSNIVRNHAKKFVQELQLEKQGYKRRGKEMPDLTVDEAEEIATDNAVVRVKGWKGIAMNGVELEATPENVKKVLLAHPFIRQQVMDQSDWIGNFRCDTD